MSNSANTLAFEPLLVRRRHELRSDADRPTHDDILPFPVSGSGVFCAVTKDTRVQNETTDDS